ncbi:putative endonuclease lcl3 [Mortierella sp. NVP85]|nr:putative endonuclease lcl3 [Mortierella sp. NVP85]
MVWPFSSNSSGGSDASSVVSSAKALFRAAEVSVEEATRSIPAHMKPYLLTAAAFGVSASAILFYRGRLRRIPTAAYLTPDLLKGKTVLRGKVTSVGDADNFRFYHTPGGIWAGWGWLRRVPTESKAQPFSQEALEWLRGQLLGKTVLVRIYARDRYDRVVSMAWYPRALPFLPMKNISAEMLKAGYGQIYRQAGSEYGGMLNKFEALEAKARTQKIGIWSQVKMVSAAEHKKQYLRGGDDVVQPRTGRAK